MKTAIYNVIFVYCMFSLGLFIYKEAAQNKDKSVYDAINVNFWILFALLSVFAFHWLYGAIKKVWIPRYSKMSTNEKLFRYWHWWWVPLWYVVAALLSSEILNILNKCYHCDDSNVNKHSDLLVIFVFTFMGLVVFELLVLVIYVFYVWLVQKQKLPINYALRNFLYPKDAIAAREGLQPAVTRDRSSPLPVPDQALRL